MYSDDTAVLGAAVLLAVPRLSPPPVTKRDDSAIKSKLMLKRPDYRMFIVVKPGNFSCLSNDHRWKRRPLETRASPQGGAGRAVYFVRQQLHAHSRTRIAHEAHEQTAQRCLLLLLIGLEAIDRTIVVVHLHYCRGQRRRQGDLAFLASTMYGGTFGNQNEGRERLPEW